MSNAVRRRFNQTLLIVFCAAAACVLLAIVLFLTVFTYRWEQFHQRYMTDHLNETLSRVAREVRENDLFPPFTEEERKHIEHYARKENVLVRWRAADGSLLFDMFDRGEKGDRERPASASIWRESMLHGTLSVIWARESENGYPLFGMSRTMNRALIASGWTAVLLSFVFVFVIAYRLTAPITRMTAHIDELYRTQQMPHVEEAGTKQLARLSYGYNYLSKQLDEQEQWRRMLMEDLAHELRTPLSIVSNQIEAMVDGIFQISRDRLEMILHDMYRLTRLVQDIEQVIQANGARFELRLSETDIVPLVKRSIDVLQEPAAVKQIRVTLNTPKVPCPVLVDTDRILQVFINLVYNAIKFTNDGGWIEVTVDPPNSGTIAVHVRDSGVGIAPEDAARIFDRFYKTERYRDGESGGSGLGLTISKRLVEAHEGRIEVWSEPDVGSQFSVYFPQFYI